MTVAVFGSPMRNASVLIGVALVSSLSVAHAAPAASSQVEDAVRRPARKQSLMSAAKRSQLAVAAVRASLDRWVKPGTQVDIRPAIVPFNGDPRNPITGRGPVEVFVTQQGKAKGFFGRLLARFSPYA